MTEVGRVMRPLSWFICNIKIMVNLALGYVLIKGNWTQTFLVYILVLCQSFSNNFSEELFQDKRIRVKDARVFTNS